MQMCNLGLLHASVLLAVQLVLFLIPPTSPGFSTALSMQGPKLVVVLQTRTSAPGEGQGQLCTTGTD